MKSAAALALVLAAYAAAQSGTSSSPAPTSTSSIAPCILKCTTQAATSSGCNSITNVSCVCTSSAFQQAARDCLTTNCSAGEQQAALQLEQQLCSAYTSASSASASPTSSSSGTVTAPGHSSSGTITSHGSSSSHTGSAAAGVSSVLSSVSSVLASATGRSNAAAGLPVFSLGAAGLWTVVGLGGAVVARVIL